jgi:hypothetical protein
MVLTISATGNIKQAVKDNIVSKFAFMAFGSGTWSGVSTGTALGNEIITVARQEYTSLTNSIIISGFLNATQGNTNTLKEVGAREASTGTFQSGRNVKAVSKTSSKELWVDEEIEIEITQEEL